MSNNLGHLYDWERGKTGKENITEGTLEEKRIKQPNQRRKDGKQSQKEHKAQGEQVNQMENSLRRGIKHRERERKRTDQ